MCNSWNHRPNCTCGWGGSGHSGRRNIGRHNNQPSPPSFYWVPPIHQSYESFVNPNAACPVCNERVFFYQAPDGGKVFFDSLGPPWPKHPCTDNSSTPKKISPPLTPSHSSSSKIYQWQKDNWIPFLINIVANVDNELLKVSGSANEEKITLYIPKSFKDITNNSVAQLKIIRDNRYLISYLSSSEKPAQKDAFTLIWEARSHIESITSKKQKTRKKSHKNKNHFVSSNSKRSQVPAKVTAMSLAYHNAKRDLKNPS